MNVALLVQEKSNEGDKNERGGDKKEDAGTMFDGDEEGVDPTRHLLIGHSV